LWAAWVPINLLGLGRNHAAQALLTPSCGTGSLDPADALKVFESVKTLAEFISAQRGQHA